MNTGSVCDCKASCISSLQELTNGPCHNIVFALESLSLETIKVGNPCDPVCSQQLHHIIVEKLICIWQCKIFVREPAWIVFLLAFPGHGLDEGQELLISTPRCCHCWRTSLSHSRKKTRTDCVTLDS